jgi:hypothetical protein
MESSDNPVRILQRLLQNEWRDWLLANFGTDVLDAESFDRAATICEQPIHGR